MNPMSLKQKVAIVTGAGRGIGREIALEIARNGGIPVVVDIDEVMAREALDEIRPLSPEASMQVANVADIASIQKMVDQVHKEYGRIDVLVNNAGILDNTEIDELDEERWDSVIDINLKGTFFCAKFVFLKMREQKSGSIVNVASVAGRMGGYAVGCAYAASKGGMVSLTHNLARKGAPHGIRVNAVAPGTIESKMSAEFTPEQLERLYANIPMKKLGTPAEIAKSVVFLASDASSFTTGAVLDMNGGMFMG